MKQLSYILILLIIMMGLSLNDYPSQAGLERQNSLNIGWVWNQGNQLPQGNISSVTITIRNEGTAQARLKFAGVRFDWMPQTSYLYGDKSEREHVLPPQEEVQFTIFFNIPENVVPGVHTAQAVVSYSLNGEDQYIVYEPVPALDVIEVVTVLYTEVVVETVTEPMPLQPQYRGSTSLYAAIGIFVMIIIIITISVYTRWRKGDKR